MVAMIVNMNEETNEFPSKLKSEHFSTSVKDKKISYTEVSNKASFFSHNF